MDFTPQQVEFIKYYFSKNEETFGNAYASGIRAGFSDEYSRNITHLMPKWLSEFIADETLVKKAYKNLDMALDGMLDDPEGGKKDIQWKATDMTLKTRVKEKFSERTELTGKDGEPLVTNNLTEEQKVELLKLINVENKG